MPADEKTVSDYYYPCLAWSIPVVFWASEVRLPRVVLRSPVDADCDDRRHSVVPAGCLRDCEGPARRRIRGRLEGVLAENMTKGVCRSLLLGPTRPRGNSRDARSLQGCEVGPQRGHLHLQLHLHLVLQEDDVDKAQGTFRNQSGGPAQKPRTPVDVPTAPRAAHRRPRLEGQRP